MKWLSTKTHRPEIGTWCITNGMNYGVNLLVAQWDGVNWIYIDDSLEYQATDVTHFIIPDALELEDEKTPKSAKDTPCVGGWI